MPASLSVILAAMLWSLGGLGIKLVEAGALATAGYRSLFAAVVFACVMLWHNRRQAATYEVAPSRDSALANSASERRRWIGIGLAGLCYALTMMCFVVATKLTSAATAIFLQYTAPLHVLVLAWNFLGEKPRKADLIAMAGCGVGFLCFFAGRLTFQDGLGIAMALTSGVFFAVLSFALRRLGTLSRRSDHDARLVMLAGNLMAACLCSPWMILDAPTDGTSWLILSLLGVFQIGIAYVLYIFGATRLRALESSLLTAIEPVLNPIWVALGTGERPTLNIVIGGAIIIASISVCSIGGRMRRAPQAISRGRP